MLEVVADGPSLVVCNTCRYSAAAVSDEKGRRGGSRFHQILKTMAAEDPRLKTLDIQEMPCLFSCSRHCSVHLRAGDKIGYVMGDFTPDEESAKALLDYIAHYLESPHGSVPYRLWPEGVKGHFIVRTPPAGMVSVK